ncbi:MAG: hydroxyacylglutathione hydrolase [Thermostichales cyanobacterium BF4_bins_65]
MQILPIPAFTDNYVFLLWEGGQGIVVDPGDAAPVLATLDRLGLELMHIWVTHHHGDHVGGIPQLLERFPGVEVLAGAYDRGRVPGQTRALQDGESFQVWGERVEVLFIPGHTRAHVAYYLPGRGDLFCGDTLFAGGCGRLIEGSPQQMLVSLQRIRQLPPQVKIWCAHEYTLKNLQFALTVDPDNPALQQRYQQVLQMRQRGLPTVPSDLATERATNPFLRWDDPHLQAAMGSRDPVRVFARLRGRKDLF